MKRYAPFLFLFFALAGCEQAKYLKDVSDPSPYFLQLMEGHDNSVFHGVDLSIPQDEVRQRETAKLYERTQDHLFYSLVFPRDSTSFSEYADIQYYFDKNGTVEIITSSIYLNDSLQQARVMANFRQYFGFRYGDAKTDDYGYEVWNGTLETVEEDYDYSVGLTPMTDEYGVILEYLRD